MAGDGDAGISDGALVVTRKPTFCTPQVLNEPHELALANAPDKDENFFKVPKVIER